MIHYTEITEKYLIRRLIKPYNLFKDLRSSERGTWSVDKLLDTGLSLDSDCDEIIDNRGDFIAVYHNKLQEKLCMQRETINTEKLNIRR